MTIYDDLITNRLSYNKTSPNIKRQSLLVFGIFMTLAFMKTEIGLIAVDY